MYFVKEPIATFIYSLDFDNTYDKLVSKLKEMGLPIEKEDRKKGKILVYCAVELIDWVFWRADSKELLFEIRQIEENRTKVGIFGIPGIRRKGKLYDLDELLSQLKV